MRRLLLLGLFILGLSLTFSSISLGSIDGKYQSIILKFRDDIATVNIGQQLELIGNNYHVQPKLNSIFSMKSHLYVIKGDAGLLNILQKSPWNQVLEYAEPNYIYNVLEAPNDPEYSKQWNLHNIHLETAWEQTKGDGVTVAVIDTGMTNVPDLKETASVEGYDFVNSRKDATDDHGHGTHVAGIVAASTNNNYGVAGIAYKAKLMPLKVLGADGSGTVANIAEAIRYAADKGADVINLSLGGTGDSKFLSEAIDYAYQKNVVIVAAAGNSNQNSSSYPARYPHVISVAALDSVGAKAPYSNFGAGIDIAAPGGSETGKILEETIDPVSGKPVFLALQGTSMASPHVAGVAALVKGVGVKEPEKILNLLKQSARKVPEDALNYYGAGQLDAGEAVKAATRGEITFQDFFRWLRDNGYLNPKFWIDGGAISLGPKILMVVGSYLLAFFLRFYFPFRFGTSLQMGLVMGSSGLFMLQTVYIYDWPHWPMRLLGSSLTELGEVFQNSSSALNPLFASVLIPLGLMALLLGSSIGKSFATGASIGVAAFLSFNAIFYTAVWGLDNPLMARSFLIVNALLCIGLAALANKDEIRLRTR